MRPGLAVQTRGEGGFKTYLPFKTYRDSGFPKTISYALVYNVMYRTVNFTVVYYSVFFLHHHVVKRSFYYMGEIGTRVLFYVFLHSQIRAGVL